ncbi:hypothetical protein [Cryobacterium aureum]|uniref:hypothetical protein n=1 Tax=Cryobacterium aureum TaxID=995037 RepID=UPI000CF40E67|nr:hypothetical protein [Cryobacterium aureum]
MQLITDVAVPIILGLLAAFGATWYSNKKNAERLEREADDQAAATIRLYIRVLDETSDYLEAQALKYGDWDPRKDIINQGGKDAVRDAFNAAAPYFHRLDVRDDDKNPLRNEFPDYGAHPMDGAESFNARAKQIQSVLDRGLKR